MSKHTENTTPAQQSNKRVQLKHVLLDVDFFDKPKVLALEYKHTALAVLVYVKWLALMSRATNGVVARDSLFAIAAPYLKNLGSSIATPELVLKTCLDTGMIFETDGGYSNERVRKDQEACALKRSEAVERQRKHREKEKPVSHALVTRIPDTDTDTDHLVPSLVLEEGAGETLEAVPTETPEAADALRRWGEYTTQTLKKPWDRIQAEALIMRYARRSADFVRDVNGSMSAGWRSVRDCADLEQSRSRDAPRGRETNHERNMRILKGISG